MKEIKFRCWSRTGEWEEDSDRQKFEMIDAEHLALEDYEPLVDLLKDKEDECYFMQYTGLKDKNGKEIYEGDIVKSIRDNVEYEVYWREEVAGFEFVEIKTKEPEGWMPNFDAVAYEFEIIGNIHENPELLK